MKVNFSLINWENMQRWMKRKVYHVVFIFSLLALSLLVAWWAFFLYQSIHQSYDLKYQSLMQRIETNAFILGNNNKQPEIGGFEKNDQLEIVRSSQVTTEGAKELLPHWQGFYIQPTKASITQLKEKFRKRRFMVIGESTLLVLLIVVSGLMIYRLYWLEKRTTQELHELWSRVSHEIKTPITGVKAFLETLRDQELSKEEMLPLIQLALQQVERQQKLAENMLVGQKIRRGGMGIQLKSINLNEFLENYIKHQSIHLIKNNVKLSFPSKRPVKVKGDSEALKVIIDNIFDNAMKYGGSDLLIEVKVKSESSQGLIIFKDSGSGFSPEKGANIFKAYKRFEEELPKGQHGTGMGLYISRQLALQMKGTLTAASEGKGKGAQFTLSLQLIPERN